MGVSKFFKQIDSQLEKFPLFRESNIVSSGLFFWISVGLILLRAFLEFPGLTWRAEPYAETATNFFYNALHLGVLENFTLLDSGYLAGAPRLIAVFTVKILGATTYFPHIGQFLGFLSIAACSSVLTLKDFRVLIPNDFFRFLISVFLGTHWDFSMYVFNNVGYYGVLPVLLFPLLKFESKSWIYVLILTFISVVYMTSKPFFAVFLPAYLLLMILSGIGKNSKGLTYSTLSFLAGVIQVSVLLKTSTAHIGKLQANALSLTVKNTLAFYYDSFENVFLRRLLTDRNGPEVSALLLILLLFGIYKLVKHKKFNIIICIILCQLMAVLAIALTVKSQYVQPLTWRTYDFKDASHFFFSDVFIFITGMVLIAQSVPKKFLQFLLILLFGFSSNVFLYTQARDPYEQVSNSASLWRIYSRDIHKQEYCFPINPDGWFYAKNCVALKSRVLNKTGIQIEFGSPQNVLSLIIQNHINTSYKDIQINAYDGQGKLIATAKRLSPLNRLNLYYKFEPKAQGVTYIRHTGENKRIWKFNDILPWGDP